VGTSGGQERERQDENGKGASNERGRKHRALGSRE
jgi:hypothetical protein